MSTVKEIKAAAEELAPQDQLELYRWLSETESVRRFRLEELRRDIAVGIEQANRGETAVLDVQIVKDEIRRRQKTSRGG